MSPVPRPALPIANSLVRYFVSSTMNSHPPHLPGAQFQSGRATLLGPGRGIGRPSAAVGSIDIPHLNVLESPVFLPIGSVRHGPALAAYKHMTVMI